MAGENDKMVKNVRKSLLDVAKVGGKYFKGTAQLFLASGSELVSREMPTMTAMIETNQDVLNDTLKFLRNPVEAINRGVNRALNSKDFKAIQKFGKNALEDLKTGDLYQKDRLRSGFGEGVDDLLDNFGDFDMSGFDAGGDYNEDDSAFGDSFDAEAKIADMQEDGAATRTAATINAVGDATEAIVATENANAQQNIRLSLKQHAQLMSGVQNMITQQGATLQAVNATATSILDVTREAHQQIMSSMENMTKLLTEIRDNTAPVQQEIEKPREEDEIIGVRGELNIKNYLKRVKKNIDNTFNISGMLGAAGVTDISSLLETIGDNPWQILSDQLLNKIIPEHTKKAMTTTGKNVAAFFPALLTKALTQGKKGAGSAEGGSWKDLIAGFFGVEQRSRSSIDTSMKAPSAQALFTNRTAMAIEQVMPMWLSKIHSALTGESVKIYNYSTGRYDNVTDVISQTVHSAKDLTNRMGVATGNLMTRLEGYQFADPKLREDFMNYAYQFFQEQAERSNFINPYASEEEFKKMMPGSSHKDFYYKLITAAMKAAPENELMALASEQMDARANRNRYNVSLHNNLRDSGTMIALAQGVLGDAGFKTENLIRRDTGKYKHGLRGEAMDELLETTEAKRVAAGGNRNTNAVVNDMLSLMRRGIITYTYVLGGSLRARTTSEPEPHEGIPNPISDLNSDADLNAIFSMLRKDAHEEQAHVDKLAQIVQGDKDRKAAAYERMQNKIREKQKDVTRGLADMFVDPSMDASLILDQQRALEIKEKRKSETENANTERLRNLLEGQSKEALEKANDMLDRTGVKGFYKNIKDVVNEPFTLVTNGLRTVDAFLFRLLYGEDATAVVYEGSKIPSLMQSFNHNLQAQWLHMKNWFSEHIGKPFKNALFGDDGIMAQIANRLNQKVVNPIKEKVKEGSSRVKSRLFGDQEIGEDGTKGDWSGGILSESVNKVNKFRADAKSEGKLKIGNLVTKLLWGDEEGKQWKGKVRVIDEDILDYDANGNPITVYNGYRDEYRGVMGLFRRGADKLSEVMFGPDENGDDHGSREKFNLIKDELHKAFPDMVIGAGLGAIGSLFLPGGPFLGAILGSAGGFVASSEKFKTYLFGEGIEEDQQYYDIKTGRMETKKVKSRRGGLIDKPLYDGIKKFAPKMGIGALAGAVAGGVGLLPFGLGPVIGGVLGSIGGMTAASDQLKKIIFGDASKVDENGNPIGDDDGLLSKNTRNAIKKALPAGLAGALGGSAAWGLISQIGLIPGLAMLPGGPILGMLGGLTAAFNHEKIEKFFFSEEVTDEKDPETGETKKVKKYGGLFGKAYDFAKTRLFEPAVGKFNEVGKSVQGWFANEVVKPFEFGMKGMKESFERGKEALSNTFKGIGKHIFESVDNTFEKIVNMPLKEFMEKKIFKPFNDITNKIFSTIGKAIGNILSAPFKAIELIFNGTIGGEDKDDRRERLRNERRDKRRAARDERKEKRRVKRLTEYEKTKMKLFGFLGIDQSKSDDRTDEINTILGGLGGETPNIYGDTVADPGTVEQMRQEGKLPEESDDASGTKSSRKTLRQYYEERNKKREEELAKRQSEAMWDQYDQENGNAPEPPKKKTLRESIEDAKKRGDERAEAKRKKKEDHAAERSDIRDQLNKQKELDNEKARIQAEERAAKMKERDEKKQAAVDAKSGDDASGGGIGRNKSTKGYLKDIASNTKKIFNEIKGQLGGSGWNLAYIKVLLDRQFGALDDKDLPEDMEGSKAVKKKRGIFGKAKDWVGEKLSGLTGVGDVIREKVGGVIDIIATPFRVLGGVIGGVKDGFLGLIDFLGGLVGKLAEGAKKLWEVSEGAIKGLMNGIGEAFIGVGGFLKETLIGAGEVLKNGVGLVANTLKDGAAIITGGIRAGFEMLFDFLPDVASMGWDGLRALGSGLLKGAKWAGRTAGGLLGKAKDAIFKKGADKESIIKKYLGVVQVDGGRLDDVPVKVGPGGKVPYPYVNVMGGRAVGKISNHAIPVYVLGFDRKARLTGGFDNPDSDTDDQNDVNEPDTSTGTSAVQAAPPDPTTLSGMVQNSTPAGSPDLSNAPESKSGPASNDDSDKAINKIDPKFRQYKKTYKVVDKKVRNAKDPGKALDQAIQNATDMTDVEAVQAVQQLNGVTTSSSGDSGGSKDKEEGGGLFDMLFGGKGGILKKVLDIAGPAFAGTGLGKVLGALGGGLGTLAKSGITTAAKNLPFLAGTVGAMMNGETDRVVTNVAKQATGKILPWAADALRIGVSGTAEEVAKSGAAAKLIAWFNGALTKLMSNKAVTNAASGVAKSGKMAGILGKVAGVVQRKFKSIAATLSGEAAMKFLKNANVVVKVASAVWDVTSGAYNAPNYFHVSSGDTTLGMRFAAGLAKGISGLAFGLIPVEWLATTIWKFFASAESEAELVHNQKEQAARVSNYNAANGTNLTEEEYNKKFNKDGTEKKGILKTVGGAIAGGLDRVGKFFGGVGEGIGRGFNAVGKTIGNVAGTVGGAIGRGAKVVGGAIGTVAGAVADPGKFFSETFPKMLGQISGHAFNFMTNIAEGTQNLFNTARERIGELWKRFQEFGSNAIDYITHIPERVATWASNTWNAITKRAGEIGTTVVNFVSSIPDRVSKWATGVWNSIGDVAGRIRDAIVGFFRSIPERVGEIVSGVWDFGRNAVSAIWNAPGRIVKQAGEAIGSFGDNFQEGFYSTANVERPTSNTEYDPSEEPQYGQGPGGTLANAMSAIARPDAMTSLLTNIGTGLGDSLIQMVKDTYKNRESGMTIFSLIGEGLGTQFLGDMKETEGKTANFSNIISNSVASVITGEPVGGTGRATTKTNILTRVVDGVKGAANKFFSWFKKDDDKEEESGKGPGNDEFDFDLGNESKWGTGVKNFSQASGKWNRNSKSMAKTGCGPTAAAMVASAYGAKNANPGEANAMSYRMGMRASDGGTNPDFFSQYANAHGGYGMTQGPVDANAIGSNLRKGQPVVMMGKGGPYGNNMHYMVADGVSGKGNVNLMDPLTGSHKSATMGSLMENSKDAVYSYGKGEGSNESAGLVDTVDGKVSTTEAQNALVSKMASILGQINYSTAGVQDPDKGTASCASTVGWAYRKVLGLNDMSGSSSYQSRDSRFTTIYVKNNSGDEVPLDILQPGDILYQKLSSSGDKYGSMTYDDLVALNSDRPLGHTEMYAGNGQDLSHGGSPKNGPVYKDLNQYRRLRTFMVRRYTPFMTGDDVQLAKNATAASMEPYANADGTTVNSATAATTAGATATTADASGEAGTTGGLSELLNFNGINSLAGLFEQINKVNSWFDNILGGFTGNGFSDEETNTDGTSDAPANEETGEVQDTGTTNTSTTATPASAPSTQTTATITGTPQTTKLNTSSSTLMSLGSLTDLLKRSGASGNDIIGLKNFDGSDPAMATWVYLRGMGFTPIAAAGVLGNLEAESGIQPNNLQNSYNKKFGMSDEEYTKAVDDNTYTDFINDKGGYGLAQWTYWNRKKKLYDKAKARGTSIGDVHTQLETLWDELGDGYYTTVTKPMLDATSVRDASTIFLQKFEQPDTMDSPATINLRAEMAQRWYDKFANEEQYPEPVELVKNGDTDQRPSNDVMLDDMAEQFGTGPAETSGISPTQQLLTNEVRTLNKHLEETRAEAAKDSTVAQVTKQITDAVGLDTNKGDPQTKLMETIASSLAVMVEHLAAIRENTEKKDPEKVESAKKVNDRMNHRRATYPEYPNTVEEPEDVGATIIDKLTSR